eukprot:Clim_evm13s40 gene=Clim_evmTU13s40
MASRFGAYVAAIGTATTLWALAPSIVAPDLQSRQLRHLFGRSRFDPCPSEFRELVGKLAERCGTNLDNTELVVVRKPPSCAATGSRLFGGRAFIIVPESFFYVETAPMQQKVIDLSTLNVDAQLKPTPRDTEEPIVIRHRYGNTGYTMESRLNPQAAFALAHEIAHLRREDSARLRLCQGLLGSSMLIQYYHLTILRGRPWHVSLFAVTCQLVAGTLVIKALNRKAEYAADDVAVREAGLGHAAIGFFSQAVAMTPPRLFPDFVYDHPSLEDRLKRVWEYELSEQ